MNRLIDKLFPIAKPAKCERFRRVLVDGKYVVMSSSQAQRYQELSRSKVSGRR